MMELSDRMPGHEDLPRLFAVDIELRFRRVLGEAKLSREHPSAIGFKRKPFSAEVSKWLRNQAG